MKRFDLRKLRKDHQLTQKQMADILGCNQTFVSQIEVGKGVQIRSLPDDKLIKLQSYFGDISAYISEIECNIENPFSEKKKKVYGKKDADISTMPQKNNGYISVPTSFFDELKKLTETIYSQQRTIEKLVNNSNQN